MPSDAMAPLASEVAQSIRRHVLLVAARLRSGQSAEQPELNLDGRAVLPPALDVVKLLTEQVGFVAVGSSTRIHEAVDEETEFHELEQQEEGEDDEDIGGISFLRGSRVVRRFFDSVGFDFRGHNLVRSPLSRMVQEVDSHECHSAFDMATKMATSFAWDEDPKASMFQAHVMGFPAGTALASELRRDVPDAFDVQSLRSANRFVCKVVWPRLFGKRADRLKTNNRGTFFIHDMDCKWLANMPSSDMKAMGTCRLVFCCGVIQGVLFALGFKCGVTADFDVSTLPACTFRVVQQRVEDMNSGL